MGQLARLEAALCSVLNIAVSNKSLYFLIIKLLINEGVKRLEFLLVWGHYTVPESNVYEKMSKTRVIIEDIRWMREY